jgi:stage IV sporulation protein FB
MESRQSFSPAIPLGVWGGTTVRMSFLLILLLPMAWGHFGVKLGSAIFGILFLSVLYHEFCHIWVVRGTGGEGDEILLWPFGGLAYCRPADTFRSEFWTAFAGPLSNLLLAAVGLWPAIQLGIVAEPFDLLRQAVFLPELSLQSQVPQQLGALLFSLNWKLFLLNMLPVYPLDGGRMLQAILVQRMPRSEAHRRCIITGLVVSGIAIFAGLWIENAWVVFFGFLAFMTNRIEWLVTSTHRQFDESFLGHDFSEGYTSLEREEQNRERQPGYFERRRLEREQRRLQKEEQVRVETESRVNQLLDKISTEGMASLSNEERRFLEQASERYRHNKPT